MNLNIAIKIAIGVVGYAAWAIMAYLDAAQRPDFLHFNIGMAVGTIGLVLRDMQAGAPPVRTDKESGRALPAQLAMLAIGAAMLAGCAGFQQALGGYEAAAAKGLRAAEDNNIEVLHFNLCATPFSAAVRNPDIIAAMAAWCVPTGKASSGTALLDAAQAAQVPK